MDYNAAMIARYGSPDAVRRALTDFSLPMPRSAADARRALFAAAETADPVATFSFALEAGASATPRGSVQNRGAVVHRLVSVGQPAPNGSVPVVVAPVDGSGDPVTVSVNRDALQSWTAMSNSVVGATKGRVSSLAYPNSPIPGAPGLVPASTAKGPLAPEIVATAAKAAGIDKEGIAVLCRLAEDGQLRKLGVLDLPGLMARVVKTMTAQGVNAAAAVRIVLPEARFSAAQFAPADADANGVRDERLPGGFTVVRVDNGSPVVITCRPIGGANARDRRIPVDVGALNSFEALRGAIQAASGGDVVIVQPDEDAALEIPGWPDRLTAKAPTSSGNGKVTNKPDGTAVGMAGGMSEAELAAFLARAESARRLDLLARTGLGRASLPHVTALRESAKATTDRAHRDRLWAESPSRYYEHLVAVVAGQRRDRQMGQSALGRAVLDQERAEDAGRR